MLSLLTIMVMRLQVIILWSESLPSFSALLVRHSLSLTYKEFLAGQFDFPVWDSTASPLAGFGEAVFL